MNGKSCSVACFGWSGVIVLGMVGAAPANGGGSPGSDSQIKAIDYAEPRDLVGRIFAQDPGPRKLLFESERKGDRTGATVHITCDYTGTDGSLVARDRILYEAGRLVSYEEEELQKAEKGNATIRPDPKHPGKWRIYFEYTVGQGSAAKTTSASEAMETDTLVDDMLLGFIQSHWDTLDQGSAAKFRYIVLSRKETVGFKLVKESESKWQGMPVVRIRMEPTSIIIARLVDPLIFVVEKHGTHRIMEYIGRTTPRIKAGNKWKELDAITVFDWKEGANQTVAR
jgi:hypothetical protein